MKKIICLVAFALCLCQFGLAQPKIQNVQLERERGSIFAVENGKRYPVSPDVITVKLKNGVKETSKEAKILHANRLGYIDLSVPEGVDVEKFAFMLEETGDFELIEYNAIFEVALWPNDTRRSDQWYLSSINAYTAWDITTGNSNVIVAVIDSGTDWGHHDLGNGTDGYSNINASLGWNYVNNSSNVITTNPHGTRVAGIIGAKTNNSRGIAGVSGGNNSSGVTIMPICVTDAQGFGTMNNLANAIIYAVDNGANVINISVGVLYASSNPVGDALLYAKQNNVVLVAASGNDPNNQGLHVSYPASHPFVIAVGAVNSSHVRAGFSNYGYDLDVVAPGVGIWSTALDQDYNSSDGTSFAAPQVAGIAALIFSIIPDYPAEYVREAIESTCTKINSGTGAGRYNYTTTSGRPNGTWHSQVGYGLVNAYAAVSSVLPNITGPSTICTNGTFTATNVINGTFTWDKSSNLSISGTGTTVTVSKNSDGPGWVALKSGNTELKRINVYAGIPSQISISGPTEVDSNGQYTANYLSGTNATVNWKMVNGSNYYMGNSSSNPVNIYFSSGYYTLAVTVANICGYNQPSGAFIIYANGGKGGSGSYSYYPNPVNDILRVEIPTENEKAKVTSHTYDVRLYDERGSMVRKAETRGGTVEFNVANLPNGMYYLHIYDGVSKTPEMNPVIIKH